LFCVGPECLPRFTMVEAGVCPRSLRLVGRPLSKENGDVCGEYVCSGEHQGRVVYLSPRTGIAVRWWPALNRWVIDREGVRESDVCVGYAAGLPEALHPADPRLLWHIWDPKVQAHEADVELLATDAPVAFSFLGRAPHLDNSSVNGEYALAGAYHGQPSYVHSDGRIAMRYNAQEHRWLLSHIHEAGNVCSAFADAGSAKHPGDSGLEWNFWEPAKNAFVADPVAKSVVAPGSLHIVGRALTAENARINGTYRLAGAHDGRPMYMLAATGGVIRYSAKHDWWLIDCDGVDQPSIMSKVSHWILSGDPLAATDRCSAYAEAHGTEHPCHVDLEWHVWETRRGTHVSDPWVRATTAPILLQVRGRDSSRENGDVNGDFELSGTHLGRPAYQKRGSRMAIRYWPPMKRWVIDREGLRTSDCCGAYFDCPAATEHPACSDVTWHVFETARGCHVADPKVSIKIAPDTPTELPVGLTAPRAPSRPPTMSATSAMPQVPTHAPAVSYKAPGPAAQPSDRKNHSEPRGTKRWFGFFGA